MVTYGHQMEMHAHAFSMNILKTHSGPDFFPLIGIFLMASSFVPLTQRNEKNGHYFPMKSNSKYNGPLNMSQLIKAIILELWLLIVQLCF